MPLPDESKAQKAKDLIARFQNNINSAPEAVVPLKVRHSFGSNEVLSEPSASRASSPGNSRRPSEVDPAPKSVKTSLLPGGTTLSGTAELWNAASDSVHASATAACPAVGAATVQPLSAYSVVLPEVGGVQELLHTTASSDTTGGGQTDSDGVGSRHLATIGAQPAKYAQQPVSLRASTPKKHNAQFAATNSTPGAAKMHSKSTMPAVLTPTKLAHPLSPLAKSKSATVAAQQAAVAPRARQQVSEPTQTPLASPTVQRKVVSPSPPAVKAAPTGVSRLMRPTAASASRSRASLGGEGVLPQQIMSVSVKPSGSRPSATLPDQDQAARTRKLSTPGSTRSSLSNSVRQTSRETPTKIAKSPLLPSQDTSSTVAVPSTPAETAASPRSLSASQSRLTRPTVSSLAHVRSPDRHRIAATRAPSGSAATPISAKGPIGNELNGARVPSLRGDAGSPLNGVKPKVGLKSSSPVPPKKLLLADKSDAAASPTRIVQSILGPTQDPNPLSAAPIITEEDRPDVEDILDIETQDVSTPTK